MDFRTDTDAVSFKSPAINLGSILAGNAVAARFALKNVATPHLSVEKINATCACANAVFETIHDDLPVNEWVSFGVTITPKYGTDSWPIRVQLSNGQEYELRLYGKIYRDVQLSQESWEFGTIELGGSAEVKVSVLGEGTVASVLDGEPTASSELLRVQYEPVADPDAARVNLGGKQALKKLGVATISVAGKSKGVISEHVTFHFDNAGVPRILTLMVRGVIRDEIAVLPDVLRFSSSRSSQRIVVRSGGKPFTIDKIEGGLVESRTELPVRSSNLGIASLELSYIGEGMIATNGYCSVRVLEFPQKIFDVPVIYTP